MQFSATFRRRMCASFQREKMIMKSTIAAVLLLFASASQAGHLDVIAFTLKADCSFGEYLEIMDEFNEWGEAYGYQAEIAQPTFNDDMATHYWLGRSANGEVFGKAYDAWVAAQGDPDSVPAALNARIGECWASNESRSAYLTFP